MEKKGLIHIYCGNGKGKTTAAVGLSVRHLGADGKVLFVQFLKDGTSSEISLLEKLGAQTLYDPQLCGFSFTMTPQEKAACREKNRRMLAEAKERAGQFSLVVLDELMGAISAGLLPEEEALDFLRQKPETTELVLTGRNPSPDLQAEADYITEMRNCRHPYEKGIKARKGIEF
jgi:cob(I)alamin adenosyltransferase